MHITKRPLDTLNAKDMSKAIRRATKRRVKNSNLWGHLTTQLYNLHDAKQLDGVLLYNISDSIARLRRMLFFILFF